MIVSRVPAVAFCLQPTELQTDSRKWISRVSNSHRLLHRTTIIIGSAGFFSLLFSAHKLGAVHCSRVHIYRKATMYKPSFF